MEMEMSGLFIRVNEMTIVKLIFFKEFKFSKY